MVAPLKPWKILHGAFPNQQELRTGIKFDEVAQWAKEYWRLTLERGDPTYRGPRGIYYRTGFVLSGGHPYRIHHYKTLRKVAEALSFPSKALLGVAT